MSTKKQIIRSATGRMIDSETVKILDGSQTLKPDDVVVVIHAEDYKKTFEKMMERISEMDEKVNDQSKLLKENAIQEKKGFIGRFRKPKE
ncbi:MAG: hypothetical protein F8N15_03930 [Methanobacterium sp.]|nr:hypothetical protein [Methanobacterium sp.]